MNITISGYNRPEYLRQTLTALSRCDDIDRCRVAVILDPCDATQSQAAIAREIGFDCFALERHVGCNMAIQAAIQYGFDHMGSEFHVHLEDDTVPTKDALRWFATMGAWCKEDPKIMSVSGYQRLSNGRLGEAGLRRWFTPWGWGTWRDRWLGLSAGWVTDAAVSWDVVVNHALRAGRFEAFPTVSRIQNIGSENGTHVPSAEWHRANHHVPETADDIESDPPSEWAIVRTDDRADHA